MNRAQHPVESKNRYESCNLINFFVFPFNNQLTALSLSVHITNIPANLLCIQPEPDHNNQKKKKKNRNKYCTILRNPRGCPASSLTPHTRRTSPSRTPSCSRIRSSAASKPAPRWAYSGTLDAISPLVQQHASVKKKMPRQKIQQRHRPLPLRTSILFSSRFPLQNRH